MNHLNLRIIFSLIFVFLCLSIAYMGNEFFVTSGHYFVLFASAMSMICLCIRLFSKKREIHVSVLDIAIIVFITYLAVNSLFVSKFPAGYLPFCLLFCFWVTYTVAKQQMDYSLFIPMAVFLILLSGIVQCTWGLLQYFKILSVAGKFKTIGSLQNPGVYANYIACIFPLAVAVLLFSAKATSALTFYI